MIQRFGELTEVEKFSGMGPYTEGKWVTFEDHQRIVKELRESVKSAIETIDALLIKTVDRGTQRFAYGERGHLQDTLARLSETAKESE